MALMHVQGSLFPFDPGSLFPLPPVQQACLAFVLVKGFCSLFPYIAGLQLFLIYTILTFDQKKKKRALSWPCRSKGFLEREAPDCK
jgi:hypothetical protein